MLLNIPYHTLDVEKINLCPFYTDKYGKKIARLTYKDDTVDLHDITILSPVIRVIDFNPDISRLRLDISNCNLFQHKLNTLHEYIINAFYVHQQEFLNKTELSYESIQRQFYYLLDGPVLSLYVYSTARINLPNDTFSTVSELKPGDSIRCSISLRGISHIVKNNTMYSKLRIHHCIPSIWIIPQIL
jgi:hypothetical protein